MTRRGSTHAWEASCIRPSPSRAGACEEGVASARHITRRAVVPNRVHAVGTAGPYPPPHPPTPTPPHPPTHPHAHAHTHTQRTHIHQAHTTNRINGAPHTNILKPATRATHATTTPSPNHAQPHTHTHHIRLQQHSHRLTHTPREQVIHQHATTHTTINHTTKTFIASHWSDSGPMVNV